LNATRIAIVGPGAIGGLFACRFAAAGYDVALLDHDARRACRISRQGLVLEEPNGTRRFRVPAAADPRGMGSADVLCLCVKAFDTAEAIRRAQPLIRRETIVVSLQNGLGNAGIVARFARPDRIVCAATAQGAIRVNGVRIRHTGFGPTSLAPYIPSGRRAARRVLGILRDAGFETLFVPDSAALVWGKLVVNAAINPVTAAWNVVNGAVIARPALRRIALAAAREAERVAAARGIALPWCDASAEVEAVCRATRRNRSSMLQDIRHSRHTEIEAITGAVVAEAHAAGVDVPVNRMLLKRIRRLERRRTSGTL